MNGSVNMFQPACCAFAPVANSAARMEAVAQSLLRMVVCSLLVLSPHVSLCWPLASLFLFQSDNRLRSRDVLHGNFHLIAVVHRVEHQTVLHSEVAAGAFGEAQGDEVVSLVDAGNHASQCLL